MAEQDKLNAALDAELTRHPGEERGAAPARARSSRCIRSCTGTR